MTMTNQQSKNAKSPLRAKRGSMDKNFTIHDLPLEKRPRERRFDKVEMYWGGSHDVINIKTRRCVATLWLKAEAQKAREYFSDYVGLNLDALDFRRRRIYAKKAKDGVFDVVVNAAKFNRRIFDQTVAEVFWEKS